MLACWRACALLLGALQPALELGSLALAGIDIVRRGALLLAQRLELLAQRFTLGRRRRQLIAILGRVGLETRDLAPLCVELLLAGPELGLEPAHEVDVAGLGGLRLLLFQSLDLGGRGTLLAREVLARLLELLAHGRELALERVDRRLLPGGDVRDLAGGEQLAEAGRLAIEIRTRPRCPWEHQPFFIEHRQIDLGARVALIRSLAIPLGRRRVIGGGVVQAPLEQLPDIGLRFLVTGLRLRQPHRERGAQGRTLLRDVLAAPKLAIGHGRLHLRDAE